MTAVCPTERRWPVDIVGCGSADVVWDPDEQMFDCRDCGLFFTVAGLDSQPESERTSP